MLKDKAAHHAISAQFPKKIDNKGKTLVVQYETKLQGQLVVSTDSALPIANLDQMNCSAVVRT